MRTINPFKNKEEEKVADTQSMLNDLEESKI